MNSRSHRVSVTWKEEYNKPVYPQLDTYGIPEAISDTRTRGEPALHSDEETNVYSNTVNSPIPPPYSCGQNHVTAYPLYGETLEVRLHQEIKRHVECFRVSVQQLLCEQLGLIQDNPTDECHVVPSDNPPDTVYGLEDDIHQPPRQCEYNKIEPFSIYIGQEDGGLCIDDMRVGDVESDGDVLMERQMDRCLIQLQTLASIVSIALKRTEYL